MLKLKRLLAATLTAGTAAMAMAGAPDGYYLAAEGKTGYELKTALCGIIRNHTQLSYSALWTAYQTTDTRTDGTIWDMYSDGASYTFSVGTDQCGTYAQEGDCYNREHSFPKSWFGGDVSPMHTDLFHIYPTDGYVNGRRGNSPFGEVSTASWTSLNGSKLGPNATGSYTGTVFEPIDEYKGDFARTYFYMATCYENEIASWEKLSTDGDAVLNGTSGQAFEDWVVDMLLRWHKADPVSDKETARNDAVYALQGNRNPFIDHPEYAESIWTATGDSGDNSGDDDDTDPLVLFDEALTAGWGTFATYDAGGSQNWYNDSKYGAKMSGYSSGTNYANDDWLISPTVSVDSEASQLLLSFEHALNYGTSAAISVLASTSYTAGTDPTAAAWDDITALCSLPQGTNWTYVSNTDIELNQYIGRSVTIAFRYVSTTADAPTWEVRNVQLRIIKSAGIDSASADSPLRITWQPGIAQLSVGSDCAVTDVTVYTLGGKPVLTLGNATGASLAALPQGVYVVRALDARGRIAATKIIRQ